MKQTLTDNFLANTPAPAPTHTPAPEIRLHVLIACEESQAECQAFRNLGHITYSCDNNP